MTPHLNWLRTVIRTRLGESQAVDDVLQDVSLAFVNGSPPAETDQLAPWLYRVAVRQTLLHRRKSGRRRKLQRAVEQNGSADSSAETPTAQALHHEQTEAVREALADLGEVDQQLLQLKYTENWTYQQLAGHLGVSATTIEYRLLRARKRLRQQLLLRDVTGADFP